ncbi:MAG: FAD:protein FMN transferase [bacterium]
MTPELHRFGHEAMTTLFEVIIAHPERDYARQAALAVFREVDRLERLLSRFDSGSDIGQINLLHPGQTVSISAEVMECLLAAVWVAHETQGAFDATIGPLLDCYQVKDRTFQAPDEARLAQALRQIGMKHLVLDVPRYRVGVQREVVLDLGAIGKGYALDKAAEILEEWEIGNALLHAGTSSVLAIGEGDRPGGWSVGVGGDWGKQCGTEPVILQNGALSGSGKEVKGEHIFDPRTGRPATGHIAAWALCPSAAVSDGLSTAFMVMTGPEVRDFCASHEDIGAYVVDHNRIEIHGKRGQSPRQ